MRKKILIVSIVIIAALSVGGYYSWPYIALKYFPSMQPITITTTDNVVLSGNYLSPSHPIGAVLLLHMMPATKESWSELQRTLSTMHIASLAIDLRGHGQSTQGPSGIQLDYQQFTDEATQLSRNDVNAAIEYLVTQGFDKHHIVLVGASIGANLSLQQLSQDPDLNSAVLLSPGLNFHGIETEQYAHSLADNQAVYLLSSREDTYSFESNQTLYRALTVTKEMNNFDTIGHGTTMLVNKPELNTQIAQWIRTRFQ